MANLLLVRSFIRPEWDNTPAFAARAVADIARQWSAIDAWSQASTTRARQRLDVRLVSRPHDTPWIQKAANDFNVIGQRWPGIEAWQSATTRPGPRLDPRRVPPPDDTPWIRAAANFQNAISQQWPGIDAWSSGTTPAGRRLDPRRVPPPDDTPWIRKAAADFTTIAQQWPGIDTWRADTVRARKDTDPRFLEFFDDEGWIGSVTPAPTFTQWAAIEQWLQASRVRKTIQGDPRYGWRPSEPWMGPAAAQFNAIASLWPGIEAWRADTIRQRREPDPRFVEWFDDTGWIAAVQPAAPFTQWAAIEYWLQAGRTRAQRRGLPFTGGDETGLSTIGFVQTTIGAVETWLQASRTRAQLRGRAFAGSDEAASIWAGYLSTTFSGVDDWLRAGRTRALVERYPASVLDDLAWLAPVLATTAPWGGVGSWRADRLRAQPPRHPGYLYRPDDVPWQALAAGSIFTVPRFAGIQDWLQAMRTRAARRLDPRFVPPPNFDWSGTVPAPASFPPRIVLCADERVYILGADRQVYVLEAGERVYTLTALHRAKRC